MDRSPTCSASRSRTWARSWDASRTSCALRWSGAPTGWRNPMNLDDLKGPWAEYGAMLERSVAINERLLRETMLTKVRRGVVRYAAWRSIEILLGMALMSATASVLGAHLTELRYVIV